ncbi:YraN family protein [Asaia spathodeae]|uniref:YraN family protein n=1 Tax=Asaia spathodeae TaxID=657016 RepID=UPI002FC28D77
MTLTRQARGHAAHAAGLEAERRTGEFLLKKGCCILATRCRTPYGEIDLIAASTKRLLFVEVKQRRTLDEAAFALSPGQQKRLLRAADYLIHKNALWCREETRFDLALHDMSGGMRWIPDILRSC